MNLRSLNHVVVLARRLSYRKAAEELGLSQSALSRSIQAVEQRAGVRLFDRDRAGVHLTSVGRAYVERAAVLLRDAEDLDRVLRRHASGAQGEIAFGIAPLLAPALAPAALSAMLASAPDLRSHVLVRSASSLTPLLASEQIEFLVGARAQIPQGAPVKSVLLGRFPSSLLVRAGHPLLAEGRPSDHAYPLITSAPFEEQGRRASNALGLNRPLQIILEDHAALLRITEDSDAVWLSSSFAVADEIAQGRICELPAALWGRGRAPGAFPVVMCTLERRSLSPAALRFKELFQARIRELTRQLAPRNGELASGFA